MSLGILEEAGQHPPEKYGITYPLFCGSLTAAQASPACFVLTRRTVMGRRMERCIQAAPESKDHRSSQVTASRSRSSQARWQVIPTVLGKGQVFLRSRDEMEAGESICRHHLGPVESWGAPQVSSEMEANWQTEEKFWRRSSPESG